MKKTLLATAIAVLSSSAAYAQDYQFEIGANYTTGDKSSVDYDGYGLNAKLHLDMVDTSKGPLKEAAFLDKSSYAELQWSTQKADSSGAEATETTVVGGRFVTSSNIIIEAKYSDLEDDSSIKVGAGTYINETMDVVASYTSFDADDNDDDYSIFSADLHGLNKLEGETAIAFDAGLAYTDYDGASAYTVSAGADYYLNNALSIGAGAGFTKIEVDDFDDQSTSTVNIHADYFVTPIARVGVMYTSLGEDDDGDSMQINLSLRF